MGQSWVILDIDTRQRAQGGKLGEYFFDNEPIPLKFFTIPIWTDERRTSIEAEFKWITHQSKSPKSKLLRLPNELLSHIFSELDGMRDTIFLCLADGRLYNVGFKYYVDVHVKTCAPWAGHRLICLGEYTEDDDWPASIRPDVEKQVDDILAGYEDGLDWRDAVILHEHYPPVSLYDNYIDYGYYKRIRNGKYWRAYEKLCNHEDGNKDQHVLCNLSKGEYVRNTAVLELGTKNVLQETCAREPDLANALLSRICWSTDPSMAIGFECEDAPLHRGVWAGDRFEVTTLDRMRRNVDWKDVSSEVVDYLRDLWISEGHFEVRDAETPNSEEKGTAGSEDV